MDSIEWQDHWDEFTSTAAVTLEAVPPDEAVDMLHFDLANETATIAAYRERVHQCEALGEIAMAEHIREILKDEQDHQIDLATALGVEVPNNSSLGS